MQSVTPGSRQFVQGTADRAYSSIRANITLETPATYDLLAPPKAFPDSVAVAGAVSVVSSLTGVAHGCTNVPGRARHVEVRLALVDTLGGLVEKNVEDVLLRRFPRSYGGHPRNSCDGARPAVHAPARFRSNRRRWKCDTGSCCRSTRTPSGPWIFRNGFLGRYSQGHHGLCGAASGDAGRYRAARCRDDSPAPCVLPAHRLRRSE